MLPASYSTSCCMTFHVPTWSRAQVCLKIRFLYSCLAKRQTHSGTCFNSVVICASDGHALGQLWLLLRVCRNPQVLFIPMPPAASLATEGSRSYLWKHSYRGQFKSWQHLIGVMYSVARANLKRGIKQAKTTYKGKIEDWLTNNNPREVWQGIQQLTNFKAQNANMGGK